MPNLQMEARESAFLPEEFRKKLNTYGFQRTPFVFIIDYQAKTPLVWTLDELVPAGISFNFNGFASPGLPATSGIVPDFYFEKYPVPFEDYLRKFNVVHRNILEGNSFLTNLSAPTRLLTNLTLDAIFHYSQAPYRFLMPDRFVCFSPEIFVKIRGLNISSCPMKGTIDATLPDAGRLLLSDPKESAEHATIVDLIRNDLSRVAARVWVERYKYLDRITTHGKALLQMSSEIAGLLPKGFERAFGDILEQLLPAGSITGAPKPKTMQIIAEAEAYDRGYYTGIMGYFDGENFETAVMIRFIEKTGDELIFKSGGGITSRSNAIAEYDELISKVYLPFRPAAHRALK